MSRTPNREQNKKNGWIGPVVVLMLTAPGLMIPLAVFGGIVWMVIKLVLNSQQGTPAQKQPRQEKFDDCPQPLFCFHKDKGEHHVRRGREMDPWDRPDIDISKYQRKR